jgi:hypothetical protein
MGPARVLGSRDANHLFGAKLCGCTTHSYFAVLIRMLHRTYAVISEMYDACALDLQIIPAAAAAPAQQAAHHPWAAGAAGSCTAASRHALPHTPWLRTTPFPNGSTRLPQLTQQQSHPQPPSRPAAAAAVGSQVPTGPHPGRGVHPPVLTNSTVTALTNCTVSTVLTATSMGTCHSGAVDPCGAGRGPYPPVQHSHGLPAQRCSHRALGALRQQQQWRLVGTMGRSRSCRMCQPHTAVVPLLLLLLRAWQGIVPGRLPVGPTAG